MSCWVRVGKKGLLGNKEKQKRKLNHLKGSEGRAKKDERRKVRADGGVFLNFGENQAKSERS